MIEVNLCSRRKMNGQNELCELDEAELSYFSNLLSCTLSQSSTLCKARILSLC